LPKDPFPKARPILWPCQKREPVLVCIPIENHVRYLGVLEGDLDIVHAVPPAFIKHLALTFERTKIHLIKWFSVIVLNKNNFAGELALDESMELLNKKFGTFLRNFNWNFNLSQLKSVFLHQALKLLF
jgi:hypothetical protein